MRVSDVLRAEGRGLTSQLRQINHSFTGVCVVSSHGSLGAQDKQREVGTRSAPHGLFCLAGRFPLAGAVVRATG